LTEQQPTPKPDPAQDASSKLSAIREFKPLGTHDDRLVLTVPRYVRLAVETIAQAAGSRMPIGTVAQWALHRGLTRLEVLREITTICEARALLLEAGSDDLIELDSWLWHLAARDGVQAQFFLRSVSPRDAGRCAELAKGLGLSTSTVGAIAIMAGLMDLDLPGDLPRLLLGELREFRLALKKRAKRAGELAAPVLTAPSTPIRQRMTWDDVFED
jgi:hypothetical protein